MFINEAEDQFLCGLLITDKNRKIVYTNQYFHKTLLWSQNSLLDQNISELLTESSSIFYDSYVVPILLTEKRFQEVMLTIYTGTKVRFPVIASLKMSDDDSGLIYWSIQSSTNRNTLYDELIATRETLYAKTQELTLLSSIDALTGLLNRRELTKRAQHEINRSKRFSGNLSMLVIDIDHFKSINDKFGHDQGDSVLRKVSHLLKTIARETDIVARFGGEEFVILMPDIDSQQSVHYAQRLHNTLCSERFDGNLITVSIGISDLSLCDQKTFDALFKQADSALYCAKETGRNRSVIHSTP